MIKKKRVCDGYVFIRKKNKLLYGGSIQYSKKTSIDRVHRQ